MKSKILFFGVYIFSSLAFADCKSWFDKAKIEKGAGCVVSCVALKVDMSTFSCHEKCDSFCEQDGKNANANLYGLTDDEIALVEKYPTRMSKAYLQSWRAESVCSKIYKISDTNDESDACRHFIWAAFLTETFDRQKAEEILNAHENNPMQPEDEKSMDLANNRRGVSVAETMLQNKNMNEESLVQEFKAEVKKGNLIILKKRPL